MESSRELRADVLSGDITVSFRLWRRAKVRVGGRYPVGPGYIEVDAVELMPFSAITPADLHRSGEKDMESLRQRAAHAGPVTDDTLLYRVEFHAVATQYQAAGVTCPAATHRSCRLTVTGQVDSYLCRFRPCILTPSE